jgi:hypothetical protein
MSKECDCRMCRAGKLIDRAKELEGGDLMHGLYLIMHSAGIMAAVNSISLAQMEDLMAMSYGQAAIDVASAPEGGPVVH